MRRFLLGLVLLAGCSEPAKSLTPVEPPAPPRFTVVHQSGGVYLVSEPTTNREWLLFSGGGLTEITKPKEELR